jgi:galactokinase
MINAHELEKDFARLWGDSAVAARPRIFRAPGRVNLIGEHTDYNGGFVMPAAIGFDTRVAVTARGDRYLEIYSRNFDERASFNLDDPRPAARGHWSDYIIGVAVMLRRELPVAGANLAIHGSVPIGSGLSSSAALEVATALALLSASGKSLDPVEVALLCQRGENEFVGARSGIMDQFASCFGKAGNAILLDCRSLQKRYEPVPEHLRLVICDTMVKHELASGEYNRRREQCETGVRTLSKFLAGIESLRDVTRPELDECQDALDPVIYRRCRHVVSENGRVLAAATALEAGDLKRFGALMIESHQSLRDDYEVSSKELDLMVVLALEIALEMEGVYGARMTGGGFGGCTINLVEAGGAAEFARLIANRYKQQSGGNCAVYVCEAVDGAGEEITG